MSAGLRLAGWLMAAGLMTAAAVAQDPSWMGEGAHWGFDQIVRGGASQSGFTFDRTMLAAADGFFGNSDAETRRIVAGLNSITVHNYHFRDGAIYDPGAFSVIEQNFNAGNWKHLVNGNPNGATQTDMWLRFEGADVRNLIVLTRGDRNMNYVAVDCHLRPLDLLHLSGHFGIPKVDQSAVMVPAPPPPPSSPAPELQHR